jgi:hypothetical protein
MALNFVLTFSVFEAVIFALSPRISASSRVKAIEEGSIIRSPFMILLRDSRFVNIIIILYFDYLRSRLFYILHTFLVPSSYHRRITSYCMDRRKTYYNRFRRQIILYKKQNGLRYMVHPDSATSLMCAGLKPLVPCTAYQGIILPFLAAL